MPQSQCDPHAKLFESLVHGIQNHIDTLYHSSDHIPVKIEGKVGDGKNVSFFSRECVGGIVFDNLHKVVFESSDIYDCATCLDYLKKIVMIAFMDKSGSVIYPVQEAIERITGVDVYPNYMWQISGIFNYVFHPYFEEIKPSSKLKKVSKGLHYAGFSKLVYGHGPYVRDPAQSGSQYGLSNQASKAYRLVSNCIKTVGFDEMKTIDDGKYISVVEDIQRLSTTLQNVAPYALDEWIAAELSKDFYPALLGDLKDFRLALRLHCHGYKPIDG